MYFCDMNSAFVLCFSMLCNIDLILTYIVIPSIIIGAIVLALLFYMTYKDEQAILARGGMRKIYSEFFDAVRRMPESKIVSETASTTTVTYLNNSNKYCKIELLTLKEVTSVTFSILFKDKWVVTAEENFYGSLSGGELLWKIIFNFPDCDLSDN